MKKWLFTLLFVAGFASASPESYNCSDIPTAIPAEARSTMIRVCEAQSVKDAVPAAVVAVPTQQSVTRWGQVAQEFAVALGIAAREIGVSVNAFVDSPAGYITVGVILWKIIGGALIKAILVIAVWTFSYVVIRGMWTVGYEQVEYTTIFKTQRSKRVRKYESWDSATDSLCFCSFLCLLPGIATIVACMIISS